LVESLQIPSLTEDIVYCPKCGAINSFKKSKSGKMLNLFCSRCQVRLNDLWDEFRKGNIKSTMCFYIVLLVEQNSKELEKIEQKNYPMQKLEITTGMQLEKGTTVTMK